MRATTLKRYLQTSKRAISGNRRARLWVWFNFEPLEYRVLLSGATGSAPFSAPVFTPLPGAPTVVSYPSAVASSAALLGGERLNSDNFADAIVDFPSTVTTANDSVTFDALLGESGGAFNASPIATITGTVIDAEGVDINKDGFEDLVVYWQPTNPAPNQANIDVFVNNGSGVFTEPNATISAADGNLHIEDMNGDGKIDLVVDSSDPNTGDAVADVYLGNGNGTFQAGVHTDFGANTSLQQIDTDVSGDGVVDAIVSTFVNASDMFEVDLGKADGSFNTTPSFTGAGDFHELDTFAGSSLPDIVAFQSAPTESNFAAQNFLVYANQGGAAFTQSFSKNIPNGITDFEVGDVNGDSKPDLVIIESQTFSPVAPPTALVELGGANGTFSDGQTFALPSGFSADGLEKIDNNASLDLYGEVRANSSLTEDIFFNAGGGTFATTPVGVTSSLTDADTIAQLSSINSSSLPDVYFPALTETNGSITDDEVAVFMNQGNQTFGAQQTTDFGANTRFEDYLFDLNNDKKADAVVFQNVVGNTGGVLDEEADSFLFYTGNGDGTFTASPGGAVEFGGEVEPFAYPIDFETSSGSNYDLFSISDDPTAPGVYVTLQAPSTPAPQAAISGNGQTIADGASSATTANDTNFGSVAQGSTAHETYTITNNGNATLTVGAISPPVGFTVVSAPSATVLAGASTTFTIGLSTIIPNVYSGGIRVVTNDPNNDPYTFVISGTVTPPAAPVATITGDFQPITDNSTTTSTSNNTDFGTAVQNAAGVEESYTIDNTGTANLTIGPGLISVPTGYTVIQPQILSLVPGATTSFEVTLGTDALGTFSGDVSIPTNDPNNNPFKFEITGTVVATPQPAIALSGDSIPIANGQTLPSPSNDTNFGAAVLDATPTVETYTISNATGTGPLDITGDITVPSGFTVTQPLSTTITPGGFTTFTVALPTTAVGDFSGNVSVPNNVTADNPYVFAIDGQITASAAPTASVTGDGIPVANGESTPSAANNTSFGSVVKNSNTVSETFNINNTGDSVLTLGTVTATGGFTTTQPVSTTLQPGDNTTFAVSLPTTTTGTFTGTVNIPTNDTANNPFTFEVAGIITATATPITAVTGNGNAIAKGESSPSATNDTAFGSVVLNATPVVETYTINNGGDANLILGTITVPTGFTVTQPASTTVAAGSSTTFTVTLPTTATGSFSGAVSIPTNDTANNPYTFDISGAVTATPVPTASVTGNANAIANGESTPSAANDTNFGSAVLSGTPVVETYTVNNTGTADLTLGTVTAPTGFTLTQPVSTTVAAGSSTTFTVTLPTTTVGAVSGNVSIPTNDTSNNPYVFAIAGNITATAVPITSVTGNGNAIANGESSPVAGNDTAFGSVNLNAASVVETYTIANSGDANLTLGTITVPSGFNVTQPASTTVAGGSSTTFTVTLPTTATGSFSGMVTIPTNDTANNPYTFDISGTVASPSFTTDIAPGKSFTFLDANGSKVTVSFAGRVGSAVVTRGVVDNAEGDATSIAMTATGITSALTITSTGGSDNGLTTIGEITDDSPIGAITAKGVDLTGAGLVFTNDGFAGKLTLHDLQMGASISEPGNNPKGISITVAAISANSTITTDSGITAFTASDWSGTGGSLTAPWIGTLKITGDKVRALAGGLGADLTLSGTGAPKGVVLGSATLAGPITGGAWVMTGSTGAITASAIDSGWTAAITGAVGGLTIKGDAAGALSAAALAKLSVTGDSSLTLTLSGAGIAANKPVLGSASVTGVVTGTWGITGSAGPISAASTAPAWALTASQAVTSITTKQNAQGTVSAASIVTFKVGGDMDADVTLTADVSKKKTLGSLSVTGTLTNSQISSAGSIGAVTLGAMFDSNILAGLTSAAQMAPVSLPTSASDFADPTAGITSVTVKGLVKGSPSFTQSIIAGGVLGAIKLQVVDTSGTSLFGVAADSGAGTRIASASAINPETGKLVTLTKIVTDDPRLGLYFPFGEFDVVVP